MIRFFRNDHFYQYVCKEELLMIAFSFTRSKSFTRTRSWFFLAWVILLHSFEKILRNRFAYSPCGIIYVQARLWPECMALAWSFKTIPVLAKIVWPKIFGKTCLFLTSKWSKTQARIAQVIYTSKSGAYMRKDMKVRTIFSADVFLVWAWVNVI